MRAVMVMFDTLTRSYLSPYGNDWVRTPNFDRLAARCCTFDRFYGGSMPCMPARRELHTGMYNFLHRSWGPLEPFDGSCFRALDRAGVYTHLVTDHSHYWEDGGATYHNRYSSWEGFRGQEGDRWAARDIIDALPERSSHSKQPVNQMSEKALFQHEANRRRQASETDMSSTRTFDAGISFIEEHADRDNWLLHIESFDPHEPFDVPERLRSLYQLPKRVQANWPAYAQVETASNEDEVGEMRREYAALVSLCDERLGRVLDVFDRHDLWRDTLLIVNTDHGFLLGEHDYLGKNFWPMHQEIVHLPFFMHVPGAAEGERRAALCRTVDIAPTLLDWFEVDPETEMDGRSLLPTIEKDNPTCAYALFGAHGNHVCITDGSYVYMRAAREPDNEPLVECTLMPTHMREFFSRDSLMQAKLVAGDRHSHGIPYLKMPASSIMNSHAFGSSLWDVRQGERQIEDPVLEARLVDALREEMSTCMAPPEEFKRLGLSG